MKKLRKMPNRFELSRRSAKSVFDVCAILGVIIVLLSGLFQFSTALFVCGSVLGFLVGLFGCLVYRTYAHCPHCGKYIVLKHSDARFCPDCGKELD